MDVFVHKNAAFSCYTLCFPQGFCVACFQFIFSSEMSYFKFSISSTEPDARGPEANQNGVANQTIPDDNENGSNPCKHALSSVYTCKT